MSIDTQQEQEAKVRKDLNVYRFSRYHEAKVLKDLNLHRAPSPLPPVHRMSPILHILHILAILLQTKEPLRSLRTFTPYCRGGAIDIKVFQTFAPLRQASAHRAPSPPVLGLNK